MPIQPVHLVLLQMCSILLSLDTPSYRNSSLVHLESILESLFLLHYLLLLFDMHGSDLKLSVPNMLFRQSTSLSTMRCSTVFWSGLESNRSVKPRGLSKPFPSLLVIM